MKTAKIYTVLSLALVFAAVTSAYPNNLDKLTSQISASRGIKHHVNVVLNNEKPLCNIYLIEIRDGNGQLVAPGQCYVSGVSGYDFYERGPASGIRIATLKRAMFGDHFICENELFTTPAYVTGPFLNGQTYRYDLFPATQSPKY